MTDDTSEATHLPVRRNWLRRVLFSLAVLVLLLGAGIAALPTLLSTDWARGRIVTALASATGKPAALNQLSVSWSAGVNLGGLRIGEGGLDDAAFLCSLERLRLEIGLLALLRRDLRLDLELSGLRLRHRLEDQPAPAAPAQPSRPMAALLRDAVAGLREALKPGAHSGDAHVRVDMADIAARIELAATNSTIDLRNAFVRLGAQDLHDKPVRLEAGLAADINAKPAGQLNLAATVSKLANAMGGLTPSSAVLDVQATAPGLDFKATGGLDAGLTATARLDLRQTSVTLRRLTGGSAPELAGNLGLELSASLSDASQLLLAFALRGQGLVASGGPLHGKSAGPLALELTQRIDMDLKAGAASLPGSLTLLTRSAARWQAGIDGLHGPDPAFRLTMDSTHFQLDELLGLARPWLPQGLRVGPSALDIARLDCSGRLPGASGQRPAVSAELSGLNLTAQDLSLPSGGGRLSLSKTAVTVDSLRAKLPGNAPGRLELSAHAALDGLRLSGPSPLVIRHAGLPRAMAVLDAMTVDKAALFGVAGKASLELSGEILGLESPGKIQIPSLAESLDLNAELPAAQRATARLEALRVDAPLLRVLRPGKRALETPLTLRLTAPAVRLDGPAPLRPAVQDARLELSVGQALNGAVTASLADGAARSSGSLALNLERLMGLAAPLLPVQAKGAGAAALDWKIAATLPAEATPKTPPQKLSQKLKRLDAIRELDLTLSLADIALDWPSLAAPGKPAEALRLRGLSTPRPLKVSTRNGLAESTLAGALAFGPMADLPGVGPLARPLRGLVTVNAAQQGVRSVQLSQLLHTEGLDLDQSLRLNLDRLDAVLDSEEDRAATFLDRVDGSVAFGLKASLRDAPTRERPGFSGAGAIEAGFGARLAGGRSLAFSARLLSPGLDLRLGPELALSGLTSSIRLDKRLALSPGLRCAQPGPEALPPLSEQVFDQPRPVQYDPGDFTRAALHGFHTGGGSLSLGSMEAKTGALALGLRDVELRLDAGGPLPALRSFRAGLLGGNLLGSAMLRGGLGSYTLETDCAFTGIDPSRLLPEKAARDLGDQAEASGRVALAVPLTPDPETLLQRLALRADITKVGPRTLERILYALDPAEQNEAIVQQRRLMGIGYPRNLRLGIAYGNLSLSGEVEVKGFRLELPKIDRLPLGNLPVRKHLAKALAPVPALVNALDTAASGGICRRTDGPTTSFSATTHPAQSGGLP